MQAMMRQQRSFVPSLGLVGSVIGLGLVGTRDRRVARVSQRGSARHTHTLSLSLSLTHTHPSVFLHQMVHPLVMNINKRHTPYKKEENLSLWP